MIMLPLYLLRTSLLRHNAKFNFEMGSSQYAIHNRVSVKTLQ